MFFQPEEIFSVADIDAEDEGSVKKWSNGLEDMGRAFAKVSESERRELRRLIRHEKKIILEKGIDKALRLFQSPTIRILNESIAGDEELDRIVLGFVSADGRESVSRFLAWLGGGKAFRLANGLTDPGADADNRFAALVKSADKNDRHEKIAKYALWILAGQASADFRKYPGDTWRLKSGFGDSLKAPSGGIGFSFNDDPPTARWDRFSKAVSGKGRDDILVLVAAGLLSPGADVLSPAGRQGDRFVALFSDGTGKCHLTTEEITGLNLLPLLCSFAEIRFPDPGAPGSGPADLADAVPLIPGTDTWPLYQRFSEIRGLGEPARTKAFCDFMLDHVRGVAATLSKIPAFDKKPDDILDVFRKTESLLNGICKNFNIGSPGRDMTARQKERLGLAIKDYVKGASACSTGAGDMMTNHGHSLFSKGKIDIEVLLEAMRSSQSGQG